MEREIHVEGTKAEWLAALEQHKKDERIRDAAPLLLEALDGILPSKLCGESWDMPDTESVTITTTFGQIKAARAAITAATGGEA